ncbi:MAG TPA: hypothetical protein PK154_05840 [Methanoregulaceae archaeon]|nr:hypothetical protein [Methanoregulaceae archaeon]HQM56345.1 hypothetical protein [Methanoregulaceae archaeon]
MRMSGRVRPPRQNDSPHQVSHQASGGSREGGPADTPGIAGELAEKKGMDKTTLLEHIHKAEKRLIGHILAQGA